MEYYNNENHEDKVLKHCIGGSYLIAVLFGVFVVLVEMAWKRNINGAATAVLLGALGGVLLIHPFLLTLLNIAFLFVSADDKQLFRKGKQLEIVTILEGSLYSTQLLFLADIRYADWTETLYNSEKHTPIWTGGMLTVAVLFTIGFMGYLFLRCIRITKIAPILAVGAISATYIGMILCIVLIVQLFGKGIAECFLCLFPANYIIICMKVVREKIHEWKTDQSEQPKEFKQGFLNNLNQKLLNSASWPLVAFILILPLLGIVICVLVLFGQQPDAVIRAWTETSDWNLSTKVAPQNIYYDEHYLCTVAAGGHRNVVKPLRMGERHGHPVIVNRQLCIANAFEQVLEEKTPRFHKCARGFYDKYGFPVARCIKSPYVADMIYFLMKPLEWIFLIVLYVVDVNPENRIAVQYLPKK